MLIIMSSSDQALPSGSGKTKNQLFGGVVEPSSSDNLLNREKYAVSLRKERKSKMLRQRREDLMKRIATGRWSNTASSGSETQDCTKALHELHGLLTTPAPG